MKKTLRNMVLFPMLMGSLLLPSCGIKDIAKNATDEIIGEENAYEEILEIYKNPAEYAKSITGNVLQKKETEREIDWYFLQGKELEDLIAPNLPNDGLAQNPCIATPEKTAEMRNELGFEKVTTFGAAFYAPKREGDAHPEEIESSILLNTLHMQFKDEISLWEFLYERRQEFLEKENLTFIKNNTLSVISITNKNLNIDNEKLCLNLLINYQKRIGNEFYCDKEIYEILDISPSESGRYFREALEFQKKFYDLDIEQCEDFLVKYLFDKHLTSPEEYLEQYQKGIISKEEANQKVSEIEREIGRKFFCTLPNLGNKLTITNISDFFDYTATIKRNINKY